MLRLLSWPLLTRLGRRTMDAFFPLVEHLSALKTRENSCFLPASLSRGSSSSPWPSPATPAAASGRSRSGSDSFSFLTAYVTSHIRKMIGEWKKKLGKGCSGHFEPVIFCLMGGGFCTLQHHCSRSHLSL